MPEYAAFGLCWRSSIALPFAAAQGHAGRPDVRVRFGETPAFLPAAAGNTPHVWEAGSGAALLHVAGTARYLVTAREIVIDPRGGSDGDITTFLVGPVLAALLQQRSVATLHAAAVETGAGAVLLLGGSGAGKSALAAVLVERGAALLADDVTGVVAPAAGGVLALPAFPRLRLWADALQPADRRQRVRRNLEQYWKPAASFCDTPQPVRAAFVLESHNRTDFDVAPVPSSRAFWKIWAHTYRKRLLDALGQRHTHYRIGMALAQGVPFVRIRRPDYPFRLAALADRIEAHVRNIASAPVPAPSAGGERNRPRRRRRAHLRGRRPAERREPSGPGIVWIAAYPKSGSTWLRAVLTNYLRDDDEPASINALIGGWGGSIRDKFDELVGLDSSDLRADELARYLPPFRELLARALSAPRPGSAMDGTGSRVPDFTKTHEAYRGPVGGARFPRTGAVGVVYLVRNPLDVAVSYAHHLQWRIDRVLQWMNDPAAGEVYSKSRISSLLPNPLTTWSGHVSSWLDQTDLRTHVARYEDLLTMDTRAGFGAVVRFSGLEWDVERLDRAVEQAAFPRLRAQEVEAGFGERQPTAPSFFRAGVAGSWRTALTREQVRALVDAHGPIMARLGYLREAEAFLCG